MSPHGRKMNCSRLFNDRFYILKITRYVANIFQFKINEFGKINYLHILAICKTAKRIDTIKG